MIESMFPLSIFMLMSGFLAGSLAAFIVFGSLSAVMISICIWLGIIRMLPIVRWIEQSARALFSKQVSQFEKNLRESFVVEGNAKEDPAIYLFHPHGLFGVTPAFHSLTSLTDWPVRIRGVAASWLFWFPVCGEVIEAAGAIPAKYQEMKKAVVEGESLAVALGGIDEILETAPGRMRLTLSRRRGVFKMALETGTPLVPVLCYGENELYRPVTWKWLEAVNRWLVPWGVCFPIPDLDSCLQWLRLFEKPLRTPVRTVIGEPLVVAPVSNVKDAQIKELRNRYFAALRKLYAETRPEGYGELEIL
jgi:2-acylglycerol O-acyltransferase 2